MHKKHVMIRQKEIEIDFIGKKGVNNNCTIKHHKIMNIIKQVYTMSSKEDPYLFSIRTTKKETIKISMIDLNKYLEKFHITTKDLRTWNANRLFIQYIQKNLDSPLSRKKQIKEAIQKTAQLLHHSPTICKNSYIFKPMLQNIEEKDTILTLLKNTKKKRIEKTLQKILYLFYPKS